MPSQLAKIAVTNQKGSVPKTTLSINVAGASAEGYESRSLFFPPRYTASLTGSAELMVYIKQGSSTDISFYTDF